MVSINKLAVVLSIFVNRVEVELVNEFIDDVYAANVELDDDNNPLGSNVENDDVATALAVPVELPTQAYPLCNDAVKLPVSIKLSAHISFATPIPPATLITPVTFDVAFVVPVNTMEFAEEFPLPKTESNVSVSV